MNAHTCRESDGQIVGYLFYTIVTWCGVYAVTADSCSAIYPLKLHLWLFVPQMYTKLDRIYLSRGMEDKGIWPNSLSFSSYNYRKRGLYTQYVQLLVLACRNAIYPQGMTRT